jgi:hypothetical protein
MITMSIRFLKEFKRSIFKNQFDNLSFLQIGHLLNTYLPFTSSSIRPSGLRLILNDIIINNRKVIFEIGSGISTVLLESIVRSHGLKIYSLDHSKEWQEVVKKMILNNGGDINNIIWIQSELTQIKIENYSGLWYDFEKIKENLSDNIDLLIVDGPISVPGYERIRYPAMPLLSKFLSKNHAVFLDDTHRKEERGIAENWAKQYSLKLIDYTVYSDMSILTQNQIYNIF